jgi:lysophospholipase L1-like esterase
MPSKTIVISLLRFLFLGLLFTFLFYPDKLQIKFEYPGSPHTDSWYVRLVKLAFWCLLVMEVLRLFYYGVVKSRANGIIANIATLITPVIIVLILLESAFMYIPQSHEGVLSKASQIWWEKYWKPVNSLGYRDKEVSDEPGKKKVLVIGDSFAAGHGLKEVNERFSDMLESQLGSDKYVVYNLGVSGADTRDEVKRLQDFPVKPDIIILEYFPNDIEKAGRDNGLLLTSAEPYADLKGPVAPIVKRFYLPNFIYWQLPHTSVSTFEKFVHTAYNDSLVLDTHLKDLSGMLSYCDSTKAQMYAVFIPFLFQVDKSANETKPVVDYLRSKNVTIVEINDGILKLPEKERVVGKNDGHASAAINQLIADRLHEAISRR